jgi:hypothetical protein
MLTISVTKWTIFWTWSERIILLFVGTVRGRLYLLLPLSIGVRLPPRAHVPFFAIIISYIIYYFFRRYSSLRIVKYSLVTSLEARNDQLFCITTTTTTTIYTFIERNDISEREICIRHVDRYVYNVPGKVVHTGLLQVAKLQLSIRLYYTPTYL